MHRFFIPPEWFSGNEVIFKDPVSHQINRVLRIRSGQHVIVLDNRGGEFEVELIENGPSSKGKIIEKRDIPVEPGCKISLYLALTQREKFEWMLQKCTEVGAGIFIPIITSRSLVNSAQNKGKIGQGQKQERWEHIVQEAAEQSGRGLIPQVRLPTSYEDALLAARSENDLVLIPYEGEAQLRLADAIQGNASKHKLFSIALFIGPEGGFSDEEVKQARAGGGLTVTLGRRILRMETAAVVATAITLDTLGE